MKKFSIRIKPLFFLTAALIGFFISRSPGEILLWIAMIFLSVLVHELGHALTALAFGQRVQIEFTAFGGVTVPSGPKLSLGREFVVVFMGPLFGFLMFIAATFVADIPIVNPGLRHFVQDFRFITLFWTIMNLLPILPLDGGQLLRITLEKFLGFRARKAALYISILFSTMASVIFFLMGLGWFPMGALFLIFAFQGVETLRYIKNYSEEDQKEVNREALVAVETLLQTSRQEEAIVHLERLIAETKRGMIYTLAKQYLAKIHFDHSEFQKTYNELLSIEKEITPEAKCILYRSAFVVGDYKKVIELSGDCFQESKTADIALYAAFSHALSKDLKKTLEWLKVVSSFKGIDLQEAMRNEAFDPIRREKAFQEFASSHQ
ncbi:MAG: M50 family metallopeptidase [Verrucomicrobia bacterium]|nr:M50 family metallopeptidase [Verrucomicrobiota bacterium]